MTPMAGGMPDDVKASLSAQIPFPSRLGEPAEFAETVGFVIGNRYLNGGTLRLDGAVRLQAK
jgi:NAD(P)-dependent dehydrogenase (short-subunit alcohol dehydrogenase family)